MAKNEPITINTAKSTEDILDVNFLKQLGIESIQELSGKNWTDYNIHDPGITILEILCFAFTELGFRSGYDVESKKFNYTALDIYRDLHCWELSFNIVPFGTRKSYSIDLRVKAPVLSDLKLSRKRNWYDFDN